MFKLELRLPFQDSGEKQGGCMALLLLLTWPQEHHCFNDGPSRLSTDLSPKSLSATDVRGTMLMQRAVESTVRRRVELGVWSASKR